VVLILWTACKKEKDDAPVFKVDGVWVGTLTQTGQEGGGYLKFELKSDGTLVRIKTNGDKAAFGTWQMAGDSLKATYTFITSPTVVNMKGVLDKNTKKLSGMWANSTEKGGWEASKQ
jgi:hypothetical protein